MRESELAQLQEQLSLLPDGDKKRLLASLQTDKLQGNAELSDRGSIVYEALQEVSGMRRPHKILLRQMGGSDVYEEGVDQIYSYIASARVLLRPPQARELVKVCLRCLARDLSARDIPVTPMTLMRNTNSLAFAVDRAYPGYAEAKMLHRIVGA